MKIQVKIFQFRQYIFCKKITNYRLVSVYKIMVLNKTWQYHSVKAVTISSQFTEETQNFLQDIMGKDEAGPLVEKGWGGREQSKIKRRHFWQERGYKGGCIIFSKCGDENNVNFICLLMDFTLASFFK